MHAITISRTLWAAHAIRLPDDSLEPMHFHNWLIEVTVSAADLDGIETVMDFHDLEEMLEELVGPLKGGSLNEAPPFRGEGGGLAVNPTAERFAQWIAESLANQLPDRVRLTEVTVTEAPGCRARYRLRD